MIFPSFLIRVMISKQYDPFYPQVKRWSLSVDVTTNAEKARVYMTAINVPKIKRPKLKWTLKFVEDFNIFENIHLCALKRKEYS